MDCATIQTLLDLLNPLHASLDRQVYDEKVGADFNAPGDAEYDVTVTVQQEHDLTQAVCILESRLRDFNLPDDRPREYRRIVDADGYGIENRGWCVMIWQPIETAPKDGTHILAYRLPIGIRTTNQTNPPTVVHWFADPDEPGFYTSVNELAPEHPFRPTHWMPLLQGPT